MQAEFTFAVFSYPAISILPLFTLSLGGFEDLQRFEDSHEIKSASRIRASQFWPYCFVTFRVGPRPGTPKVIEAKPILNMLGGKKHYEKFVLEGMSENHNEQYYAVEDRRFLGDEEFGAELGREVGDIKQRAAKELSSKLLRPSPAKRE